MRKITLLFFLLQAVYFKSFSQDGWTKLNSTITQTINSLYFTDDNTGFAAANGGTLIKTTNSGTSWSAVSTGTNSDLQKVMFNSSSNGYLLSKSGQVLQTSNSGNSWSVQSLHTLSLNGISFFGSKGIIVGDEGFIATTNDGSTWTKQNNLGVFALNDVYFYNDTLAIAIGASGKLFRSADAGINWTSVNSGSVYSFSAIEKMPDGTLVIVGSNGTILSYQPISKTLTNISASLSVNWLKDIQCSPAGNCYISGYSKTLLINNAGWKLKTLDTEENYNSVFFSSEKTGFMAGLNGVIYKSEIGGFAISTAELTSTKANIYPNPFDNYFIFELKNPNAIKGDLKIYDANGKLVQITKIHESNQLINTSTINPGVYFTDYQTNTERFTQKLFKL